MAFVSVSSLAEAFPVTMQIPVPAGAAAGHIVVVSVYAETSDTLNPAPGFTLKADLATGAPSSVGRLLVFWKRLTAADTGTYDFPWASGNGPYCGGVAQCFSGRVATGDPFEASSTNEVSATTTIAIPAVTASSGADLIGSATAFNSSSWTPPAGMTEDFDATKCITAAHVDAVASGSTGAKSFTHGVSSSLKGFLGSLAPAISTITRTRSVVIG